MTLDQALIVAGPGTESERLYVTLGY